MRVWTIGVALLVAHSLCNLAFAEATYKCSDSSGVILYTSQLSSRHECECISGDECPAKCDGTNCSVKITKDKDGHFYVFGRINDHRVRFLIDTGATDVSISRNIASASWIFGTTPRKIETAGGIVNGSSADGVSIAISGLPPIKSRVTINPSMSNQLALLGQSYLQRFKITIDGRVMTLSAKK